MGDTAMGLYDAGAAASFSKAGYRIVGLLGRGGMGEVYRAEQLALGREVALKVIHPERLGDEAFERRFDREARALAKLRHPHIVTIHDRGLVDGQPFLVMELIEGPSLEARLAECGKLPCEELYRLGRDLASALAYAHRLGVIHRDLKPSNVLLDPERGAVLTDFGIARARFPEAAANSLLTRATREGQGLGSLDYMAPEQREDASQVDARADLYSLGVLLYRAAVGHLPSGVFEPPGRLRPDLPPRFDETIEALLQRDPQNRPHGALVVAHVFEAMIERAREVAARKPAADVLSAPQPAAERELHEMLEGRGRRFNLPLLIAGLCWPLTLGLWPAWLLIRRYRAHMQARAQWLRDRWARRRANVRMGEAELERRLEQVFPRRIARGVRWLLLGALVSFVVGFGHGVEMDGLTTEGHAMRLRELGISPRAWDRLEHRRWTGGMTQEERALVRRYDRLERAHWEEIQELETGMALSFLIGSLFFWFGLIGLAVGLGRALRRHTAAEALLVADLAGLSGARREQVLARVLRQTRGGDRAYAWLLVFLGLVLWPLLISRHLRYHERHVEPLYLHLSSGA